MTAAAARTVKLGTRAYPVVLPSVRDPRLHLAMVIVSIHLLGQVALDFRVSVPQLLSAILTCAVIEVVWVFRRSRQLVWPASAMLTGSGVALILRLVGMERGDHWSWRGWYLFALVGAASLLSKYLVRFRGEHVFNPSNVGLVAAFLVLGSNVIEPLDFWWAPPEPGLVLAYLIILAGGLVVTARLRLLPMAATFWAAFTGAIGLLAASGHCITAAWAVAPVCGRDFWRVVVTSPEVLIFLFFMITDPKTIPARPWARVGFALCLALFCTLLMAPQSTEFGAKVGLLAGLVLLTPLRPLFDRARLPAFPVLAPGRLFAGGAALGSVLVLLPVGIVVAGAPAREQRQAPPGIGALGLDLRIDRSALPQVALSREAAGLNGAARDPGALAVALAEDLAIEREAMLRADTSLLRAADDGERLLAMERKVQAAATAGRFQVADHRFDTLRLDVVFTDGPQGGATLGLEATGRVRQFTYDAARTELERAQVPFRSRFVLRQGAGGRWVILSETPLPAPA